jgi:predicted anti-sigma-YlaC factor YlaD
VKQGIDCTVFQEQLEALQQGGLTEEATARLRRHADSCPDCAMLLQLQEHVTVPREEELEAAVPEEYVTTMWERVQADLAVRGAPREQGSRGRRASRWLVPALAAASLFFLVVSGLMLGELMHLKAREAALVQRIADHERRLVELDQRVRTDPVVRTANLAGTRTWIRLLERRRSISVAELEALVAGLPVKTTVVGASEWRALEASIPVWLSSVWSAATEAIQADDGVQAGELAAVLAALDLDPGRRVPTARILALTGAAGPGRL